ncbi:hypothetical protein CYMTET_36292 [Cymbomonas tetramitiformis]|uniref:Uncharacterized protein n=1 Tax=Cymbomonas tetramitiformis TaxID=36881 RepID=A0AAE0CG75_9CHLO|nr:hypothetical protein CYMTET_36292 [Cymbomonas tetramitiformis]|eukprot:gene5592-6779_t
MDIQVYKEEHARYTKIIEAAAERAPDNMKPYAKHAKTVAPAVALLWVFLKTVGPLYYKMGMKAYAIYETLPHNLVVAIYGFLLCFFGGKYCTLIAAIETFKLTGWTATYTHVKVLWEQHKHLLAHNAEDDKKDDDGNGIADVDELSADKLLTRKILMALRVTDPDTVNRALAGVYAGCIGVIAALKVRFAKTIMLGISIGNMMKKPAYKFALPAAKAAIPAEYHKWITVVIDYVCKAIALSIVWWIQRVISAFHSALQGGQFFARGLFGYLKEKGHLDIDLDQTYFDELLAWGIGFVGVYFQIMSGFSLPFPLNVVFLPLDLVNWSIEWVISD